MNIHSQAKAKVYYCKPTFNPTYHFYETAYDTSGPDYMFRSL